MPRLLVGTINNMVFVAVNEIGYFAMNKEDAESLIEALQRSITLLKEVKETRGMWVM